MLFRSERSTLMGMVPHLAQPLAFVLPVYRTWQWPVYGLGLKWYDHMAGDHALGPTRFLSREQTLQALPGVSESGLIGGIQYWDGQFEDARYALFLAQSLANLGGVPVNHVRVQRIEHQNQTGAARFALHLRDALSGRTRRIEAAAVVNATEIGRAHV